MSTEAPGAPRPITPQDPPQFPCWLWCSNGFMLEGIPGWIRPREFQFNRAVYHSTHWHPDQPTAPEVRPEPAPAETGTPTPEYSTPLQIADAFGGVYTAFDICGCADAIQRLIDQQLAAVTRERDEARVGLRNEYERAERFLGERNALRHSLAAAEALLEKRTKALEEISATRCVATTEEAMRGGNTPLCAYESIQATAEAALALTPEQALAEKEGRISQ